MKKERTKKPGKNGFTEGPFKFSAELASLWGHGKDGPAKPSWSKCVMSGVIQLWRLHLLSCRLSQAPGVCSTIRFSSILPRKLLPEVASSVHRPQKSHEQPNSTCSPQLCGLLPGCSAPGQLGSAARSVFLFLLFPSLFLSLLLLPRVKRPSALAWVTVFLLRPLHLFPKVHSSKKQPVPRSFGISSSLVLPLED